MKMKALKVGCVLVVLVQLWSELNDGLNSYVFLPILLAKGERLALPSIFLGSLYAHLDECVSNITRSLGP